MIGNGMVHLKVAAESARWIESAPRGTGIITEITTPLQLMPLTRACLHRIQNLAPPTRPMHVETMQIIVIEIARIGARPEMVAERVIVTQPAHAIAGLLTTVTGTITNLLLDGTEMHFEIEIHVTGLVSGLTRENAPAARLGAP